MAYGTFANWEPRIVAFSSMLTYGALVLASPSAASTTWPRENELSTGKCSKVRKEVA